MSAKKREAESSVAVAEPAEKLNPLDAMRRHVDDIRAGEDEEARDQTEHEADVRRRYVEVVSRLDNPQTHDADVLVEAASVFKLTPEQVERDAAIIRQARELLDLHSRRRELSAAHSCVLAWKISLEARMRAEGSAIVYQEAGATDAFRASYDALARLEALAAASPSLFETDGIPRPLGDAIPVEPVASPGTATREEIATAIAEAAAEFDAIAARHREEQFAAFSRQWRLRQQLEQLPALPVDQPDDDLPSDDDEFDDSLDDAMTQAEAL